MSVLALLLASCSREPSHIERTSTGDLSNKTVRVVFDVPGDDIGGQESKELLGTIKDEITRKNIAEITSSGFGMGSMEVILKYHGTGSIADLRGTIQGVYPKARYRIESIN